MPRPRRPERRKGLVPEGGAQEGPRPKAQEDVVDADFEDVKKK